MFYFTFLKHFKSKMKPDAIQEKLRRYIQLVLYVFLGNNSESLLDYSEYLLIKKLISSKKVCVYKFKSLKTKLKNNCKISLRKNFLKDTLNIT